MPLSPGDKLGPYEIQSKISAGGMGDVYKARDTRLSRTVAIKVLPPESATDPERRKRFELEARAVAALNHPNVVAIYDVGAEAGVDYIVQELIDGESLRARLSNGPILLRAALPIAAAPWAPVRPIRLPVVFLGRHFLRRYASLVVRHV